MRKSYLSKWQTGIPIFFTSLASATKVIRAFDRLDPLVSGTACVIVAEIAQKQLQSAIVHFYQLRTEKYTLIFKIMSDMSERTCSPSSIAYFA